MLYGFDGFLYLCAVFKDNNIPFKKNSFVLVI